MAMTAALLVFAAIVIPVCLLVLLAWSDERHAITLVQCDSCHRLASGDSVRWMGHAPVCPRCAERVAETMRRGAA